MPTGEDISIGGYNFGVNYNGDFSVGFSNYGAQTTIGISSAGFTFSNSYTNSNGVINGGTYTYNPGGYAVLAVLGGILCLVTDGIATPLLAF